MHVIGLTGSIGMGKSATAAMFRAQGIPVHDADAAVHRLFRGAAVAAVEAMFPGVAVEGSIDRARLAARVTHDTAALRALESVIHPLVVQSEASFLETNRKAGHRLAVLDVPLLLETGGFGRVDTVVVVSADPKLQRDRVLARPGMTEAKFAALLARQMPDREKRARAHFLVDTGRGFPAAERQVRAILRALAAIG